MEIATFDNTSQAACVIDTSATASGINIASTHTGPITAGANVTLGTDGFAQAGGAFAAASFTITDAGNWSESSAAGFSAGTGTVNFNGGTGTIQLLNSGGSAFNNVIHSGAGTVQLTANPLTINGALSDNAGRLEVNGLNLIIAGLTSFSSGTIQNSGASDTLMFFGGLNITGSTLPNVVLSTGLGTAVLGAGITSTSGATVAGKLDLGGANRTFTVTGNSLDITALISDGGLTKDGSGFLSLSHVNFYSGGTFINAGLLGAGVDGALGPGTGGTTVASGAGLVFAGLNYGIPEPVTLNGGSIIADITISGKTNSVFEGPIILGAAGGSILTSTGRAMFTLNGSINAQGFSLGVGGGTIIFNGGISGTNAATLTEMAGTVTLNGTSTYGGGTAVSGGTLVIGNDSALGTGTLTMGDNTTITTAGPHTLPNNVVLDGFVTVDFPANLTVNGAVSGTGGVVGGRGALLVNGNLALNGDTAFNGLTVNGSVFLNGNTSFGGVGVESGGTLEGSASIAAGLTIENNATLIPASPGGIGLGRGPGVFTAGFLTLNGGTIHFIVNGLVPGTGYSQIRVQGNLNLGSGVATLELSGSWTPRLADKLRLIDNLGPDLINGFFKNLPEGTTETDPNFGRLRFAYQGGDGNDMVVTKVEEVLAGRVNSTGQWWLGQSDGSSFTNFVGPTWSTAVTWVDVHTGDFNGDGHDDLAGRVLQTGQWWVSLSDGSGGFTTSLWDTWSTGVTWVDVKVGDFTGGGGMDIVGRALETGQWWMAVPTLNLATDKFDSFTNSLWATWSTKATWVDVQVGHFENTSFEDITGRWQEGGSWWTAVSTGNSFATSKWAQWSTAVTWVDVNAGDFNGDHITDIVGRVKETGQWWVGISTESSFANSLWAIWSTAATWVDVKVGDFNGDSKSDIIGRALENGQWWVALSNGSGFTNSRWDTWSTSVTWVDVQVGDFNGDGKADITGRWLQGGSWWTAVSNGTSFATTQWTQWSTAVTWVDVQNGAYV